jgi:hypothetical protein
MKNSSSLTFRRRVQLSVAARFAPAALLFGLSSLLGGCTPDEVIPRCELPYDQRDIDLVATGAVTVSPQPADPNTFTAQVDATAGGSMMFSKNAFVYLDLINGKKVDITDVQASASNGWDIAFKRWQIKLNGGTSGPGGVGAERLPGKTLAEVTTAPAGSYPSDSYFDEMCGLVLDDIGGIKTLLADWYDYESGTMRLAPKKEVIVLTRRDGKGHIKVQLTGYYKGTVSANYELSWSLLP